MKLNTKKCLRYDYVINMLESIGLVLLIITVIAFLASMIIGGIIFLLLSIIMGLLIFWRLTVLQKKVKQWKGSLATGKIANAIDNRGNIQVQLTYTVNDEVYHNRWLLLGGKKLMKKVEELESLAVLYNPEKPKQAIVVELFKE